MSNGFELLSLFSILSLSLFQIKLERMMMQVSVEDINSVKKTLHIEIPEADVVRELDQAYNQLKKKAKVKGFRPGKVPRSFLVRRFHSLVGTMPLASPGRSMPVG